MPRRDCHKPESTRRRATRARRHARVAAALAPALMIALATGGCPGGATGDGPKAPANTTDRTNGGAALVGSAACRQCHADVAAEFERHGHAHALTALDGALPVFPLKTAREIPSPPEGLAWDDLSYAVGGYRRNAIFAQADGFLLTTGETGIASQWLLDFGPNGAAAGYAEYAASADAPQPFDYACFRCHTTGAAPQDPDDPRNQEGRPGFVGTWHEAGAQCESCHGPGGRHFRTSGATVQIDRSRIFIDVTSEDSCRNCHAAAGDPLEIPARDGFIEHFAQWSELQASGHHAQFACTVCHDPHRSVTYDRAGAIRNECRACHADMSMAGHAGKTLRRSDGYEERLTCESCHMPFAGRSGAAARADLVGTEARVGDLRTHIFRINTSPGGAAEFFTDDGTRVRRDADGLAGVTVDFVCLRCHNESGPFPLTLARAAEIAPFVHLLPE